LTKFDEIGIIGDLTSVLSQFFHSDI